MRAAIYVRQSQDKSGEGAAVSRQLAECQDLATKQAWTVGQVYRDNDASATKGERPAWKRLLADLDTGMYDVLVCWHNDRLYRRLRDLADLLEIAERQRLRIATVTASDMDLSTPAGRFMAGQMAGVARYEVEQKGARQMAANRARAMGGVSLWTRRPFGFDRDGHDVFVVETEATELRKAADAVLEGASVASVARDWNERGVLTSLGNTWHVKTVRQVLLNPRNVGRVVYRGEDMGTAGPTILDIDTYERLTALFSDPRRKNAPSTTTKYLLSGLARCGRDTCEREVMLATSGGTGRGRTKYLVYRCRRCYLVRHLERVDEVVRGVVVERLGRPDASRLFSAEVDVAALRSKSVELRDRRDGLAAMLAEGLLSPDVVRQQAKKLTDQIETITREIEAVEGDSPLAEVVGAEDVAAAFEGLPLQKKRAVIKLLCDVVILPAGKGSRFDPDQIRIEWKA